MPFKFTNQLTIFLGICLLFLTFLAPSAVFAECPQNFSECITNAVDSFDLPRYQTEGSSSGSGNLSAFELLKNIIEFLLAILSVLALLAVVISGIMYVLSLGDESRATKAKHILLYAILGLIIAGTAWLLVITVADLIIKTG